MEIADKLWIFLSISIVFFSLINLKTYFFFKENLLIFFGTILATLLFQFYASKSFEISIPLTAGLFSFFYCPLVAIFLNKEILPFINERLLHITAILYTYNVLLYSSGKFQIFLIAISIIPLVSIFYQAIVMDEINPKIKILLYTWYVFMLFIIQILQFSLLEMNEFVTGKLDFHDLSNIFFLSGLYFYICIYVVNLIGIIPYRILEQTEYEMKERIANQSNIFQKKFGNQQASPFATIILSIFLISIIFINFRLNFTSSRLLIQGLLIIALIISSLENFIIKIFESKQNN